VTDCPICKGTSANLFQLYDDRYGYAGRFWLMRCRSCAHRFLAGAPFSDAEIQALYTDYYPRRSMRPVDYQPDVEKSGIGAWLEGAKASAFRWVPPGVKVLDIGCGFGQALGYHANRGCEVWGVESDENIRPIADLHGFKIRVGVFKPEEFPQEYFDVVTMDQVIEHMGDPIGALASVRKVLKPGGIAILGTPNPAGWGARVFGQRWINWHAPYHLHLFTGRSMQIAAERAGLVAEPLGTLTSSEWLFYQWLHLATQSPPGCPAAFWTGGGPAGGMGKALQRLAFLLHRSKVNHLLTRLFDGLGIGDSQLFRLRRA
jgi:2-polyprenyl-3-methyl-5-hydroxy-6-metoxy-1,4-benzoquinol methylase